MQSNETDKVVKEIELKDDYNAPEDAFCYPITEREDEGTLVLKLTEENLKGIVQAFNCLEQHTGFTGIQLKLAKDNVALMPGVRWYDDLEAERWYIKVESTEKVTLIGYLYTDEDYEWLVWKLPLSKEDCELESQASVQDKAFRILEIDKDARDFLLEQV